MLPNYSYWLAVAGLIARIVVDIGHIESEIAPSKEKRRLNYYVEFVPIGIMFLIISTFVADTLSSFFNFFSQYGHTLIGFIITFVGFQLCYSWIKRKSTEMVKKGRIKMKLSKTNLILIHYVSAFVAIQYFLLILGVGGIFYGLIFRKF